MHASGSVLALVLAFVLALGACSSDGPPGGSPDAASGWVPLVTKDWSLAPGTENTSELALIVLDRDIFVGGIRPIAPLGTHHSVLARGTGGTNNIIYASGVGTNELVFPPGAGLRLASGSFVGLQLHVYNTSENQLTGTSGVEVLQVDPGAVVDEVDLLLAGPTNLSLPPGQTTQSGTCTATARQTLFALFPHMHQLGTNFKTTVTVGGVSRVLHDDLYEFDHQAFLPLTPVVLAPGDTITSECTWTNPGPATVTWGESSDSEMCFSILYRYPTIGGGFCDG